MSLTSSTTRGSFGAKCQAPPETRASVEDQEGCCMPHPIECPKEVRSDRALVWLPLVMNRFDTTCARVSWLY